MYAVAVRRAFRANHYLIGGDFGAENHPHHHDFVAEARLESAGLDQHGYVYDISVLERALESAVAYVGDKMLNDLPELAELNPSVENLARLLAEKVLDHATPKGMRRLHMRVWEGPDAWASYEKDL